jgi:hypothetical protein
MPLKTCLALLSNTFNWRASNKYWEPILGDQQVLKVLMIDSLTAVLAQRLLKPPTNYTTNLLQAKT